MGEIELFFDTLFPRPHFWGMNEEINIGEEITRKGCKMYPQPFSAAAAAAVL